MVHEKITHIKDHFDRAFKELFPEMAFILDKTLTTDEVAKRTIEHGSRLRTRVQQLESQPN